MNRYMVFAISTALGFVVARGGRRFTARGAGGYDPKWVAWAKRLRKGSAVEFGGHRAKLVTAPAPKDAHPAEQRAKLLVDGEKKPFLMDLGRVGPLRPFRRNAA